VLPSIAGEHDGHAAHAHLKRARAFREAQYEAQVVLRHRAAAPPARPRPPGSVSDVGSHGKKVTPYTLQAYNTAKVNSRERRINATN